MRRAWALQARLALAGTLVLLSLCSPRRAEPSAEPAADPHAQLFDWVTAWGGELSGVAVGRACAACPRGLLSTRDVPTGGLIMQVPMSLALRVSDVDHTEAGGILSAGEYARELLVKMHGDPAFNATWAVHWAAQPPREETFTAGDLAAAAERGWLQQPHLEHRAVSARGLERSVFLGSAWDLPQPALPALAPDVTWEVFEYIAALVESRTFGPLFSERLSIPSPYLMPAVELINHSNQPNADRALEGIYMAVRAKRDVVAGEEVTFDYQYGVIHRPDLSLYIYGFVIPQTHPPLCAVDLPTFDASDTFAPTPLNDSALYEDPASGHVTWGELDRLAGILSSLPTTELEDVEALEALGALGDGADWRERAVLTYRVMRKRALRQTIERLSAALQSLEDGGGGGGQPQEEL